MVSLALQDAYLQVPIHHDSRRYLRFVVQKKDIPVRGPLLRSHNLAPRLHEDYGSHFRHPPQVWTIDSSWPLQNSSLVYLGVEIRSAFYGSTSSRRVGNLLRLLEEFLSTPSPPASLWHRILGHLSSLTFLVPDGMFRMRLLQPCLQDQWDFLDNQSQVSWFALGREFSSLVDSSGPAA